MSEAQLLGEVVQTNEQYHAGPGISKSKLDAIAESGLNFWDKYINPDREPEEFKHCFAVGDGTHKIVLEPGTFEQTYAVDFDRSAFPTALDTVDQLKQALADQMLMTNGAKPELARRLVEEAGFPRDKIMMLLKQDHEARMAGKIAIPARDYKSMLSMLKSVQRHPWAAPLLKGATVERSFYTEWDHEYIDHQTGKIVRRTILVKCRTDAISADGQWVLDLKTTDDVSKNGFGRTIVQRRYDVQGAFYLDILRSLYGKDAPRGFAFIPAQKLRPNDVSVQYLDEDAIERGRKLYQRDITRLLRCEDANYWPGVDEGKIIKAELPYWANRDLENLE